MVSIFDPACELLPPWTKELYMCTVCTRPVAPLLYLLCDLLPPSHLPNVQYIQTVCDCGGEGVGSVEMYCGPYSAGVLHSVSDQIQNLQKLLHHPKQNDQ